MKKKKQKQHLLKKKMKKQQDFWVFTVSEHAVLFAQQSATHELIIDYSSMLMNCKNFKI